MYRSRTFPLLEATYLTNLVKYDLSFLFAPGAPLQVAQSSSAAQQLAWPARYLAGVPIPSGYGHHSLLSPRPHPRPAVRCECQASAPVGKAPTAVLWRTAL